jgi:predicted DNA-binding transcriptional regulator AlpA
MSDPVVWKPLLTADELSAEAGLAVSLLYRWVAEGHFPTELIFRVGRRIYFKRALVAWLAGVSLDGTPGATTARRVGAMPNPAHVEPLVPGGDPT